MQSIVLLVVMLGVFYALMILPQRRQQRKRAELLRQLEPGAKILTQTGFYGRINAVKDDILYLELAPDVEVEMDKRAVLQVVEPPEREPEPVPE